MVNEVVGVVGRFAVRPGDVDEFVALAQRTMIEPAQAVPGCIRYELRLRKTG